MDLQTVTQVFREHIGTQKGNVFQSQRDVVDGSAVGSVVCCLYIFKSHQTIRSDIQSITAFIVIEGAYIYADILRSCCVIQACA